MQKATVYLSFHQVGDFALDVYRVTAYDGFKSRVHDFFVEISMRNGLYCDTYELRHFKSRQGAERFCQRFVKRHSNAVL